MSTPLVNCHCPVCHQALDHDNLVTLMIHIDNAHPGFCYCGLALEGHLRCVACGIYIGTGHVERQFATVEGHTLCPQCVRLYRLNPKKLKGESILCHVWGVPRLTARSHNYQEDV